MRSSTYHKTILENGIRIISEKISRVRSISLGVWINVGSKDEKSSQCGVSHFIEHMLFKGTKTRSARDIAVSLESLGGALNAFTGREQTCYYARILDEHLPAAIDVLSDILMNSLVTQVDFKKERKVILEELKDLEDTPSDLVHDILMQTIWPNQALGQPISGTQKSISKLTRRQLLDHKRKNYSNPNVVISASGNLEHRDLVEMVREYFEFSAWYEGDLGKPNLPRAANSNSSVVERDCAQTHICLAIPSYPYITERRYASLILNNILGGGMSSRLFQTIRENLGLAYSIYSFVDFFKDTGVFGVCLATNKNQIMPAIHAVLEQIKNLKTKRLSAQELEQAKNQLKGNLMLNLESTSNQMNRLARNELYLKRHMGLDQTLSAIDRVKTSDVYSIAKELFDRKKFCLAILGPTDKGILQQIDWGKLG